MSPTPSKAPAYVLWEITLACNLRCAHCAAGAGRPRRDELTTEEALGLCDELADLGVPSVCMMGGEPLIRRDWPLIAGRLRERGIEVAVITNGWRFNDDAAAEVERLGICQVGTSLDAADPDLHDRLRGRPGAHRMAMEAIHRMAELPLAWRTVITSVSRSNLPELTGIRDLLLEHAPAFTWMVNVSGCHDRERFDPKKTLDDHGFMALTRFIHENRTKYRDRLNITATHDLGYFSRRFPDLHDFEWNGCAAGLDTLGIRSNGDVTGCLVMDDSFIEGNVRRRSIASLWADPKAFTYNRAFTPAMLEGACRGCDLGARCRGGCRDHAASYTGSRFDYPFCLHRLERDDELKGRDE
ncbi:MAG: radical SAM protein [Deltaproteobacteria bacterium]|nr:radical SAM protein [Deltaproteobacteria bacterium]